VYPEFKVNDRETIEAMYKTFEEGGDPLPKDPELIDFGFEFEN
jgi:hypothetical protein